MSIVMMPATELAARIRARQISARAVMAAYLDHIDRINPAVNAIVSLRPRDVLLAEADAADAQIARGEIKGWMHGLPHAVKDLAHTKGLRTTLGSPLFADFVPPTDAIFVERLRASGAIIIGKTNTPEFGLGSQTYNPVFGTTGNAYDPSRTSGGSSGGAAVGLALRMLPVADGSDFAGSLRNPAGWNNVFGFRPSAGRVPFGPTPEVFMQSIGRRCR
jgi:amidase